MFKSIHTYSSVSKPCWCFHFPFDAPPHKAKTHAQSISSPEEVSLAKTRVTLFISIGIPVVGEVDQFLHWKVHLCPASVLNGQTCVGSAAWGSELADAFTGIGWFIFCFFLGIAFAGVGSFLFGASLGIAFANKAVQFLVWCPIPCRQRLQQYSLNSSATYWHLAEQHLRPLGSGRFGRLGNTAVQLRVWRLKPSLQRLQQYSLDSSATYWHPTERHNRSLESGRFGCLAAILVTCKPCHAESHFILLEPKWKWILWYLLSAELAKSFTRVQLISVGRFDF